MNENGYNELVKAARLIKSYCTGRACSNCIFCKEFCVLETAPEFYDLPSVKVITREDQSNDV